MSASRWITCLLLGGALIGAVASALQWQTANALKQERMLLRDEQAVLGRLQAENARLNAGQPAPAELARLRADRAALLQLRAELESLKAAAERKEAQR